MGTFISFSGSSNLGPLISTLGIFISVIEGSFISPLIFGAFISKFGIFISGPLISIDGIFIFLTFLTPTVTSGIFNIFLFNIIGSSILPLNIVLIFNGWFSILCDISISGTLTLSPFIFIPGISTLGILISPSIFPLLNSIPGISIFGSLISIFGSLMSKIVLISGPFISPSIFGILKSPLIFGALISNSETSIFGALISTLGILISPSIFGFSISILGIFIFSSNFGILIFTSGNEPSIFEAFISAVRMFISDTIGTFTSP